MAVQLTEMDRRPSRLARIREWLANRRSHLPPIRLAGWQTRPPAGEAVLDETGTSTAHVLGTNVFLDAFTEIRQIGSGTEHLQDRRRVGLAGMRGQRTYFVAPVRCNVDDRGDFGVVDSHLFGRHPCVLTEGGSRTGAHGA